MGEPLSGMMKRKLTEKMNSLDASLEKITSLSKMMGLNYHKSQAAVNLWWESFQSTNPKRYLTFIYVANDIMQNTRKMGTDYVDAFLKVLSEALCLTIARNPKLLSKIKRLIQVWGERKVISSTILNQLLTQVTSDLSHIGPSTYKSKQVKVVAVGTPPSPGTPPGTPPPECVARSRLLLRPTGDLNLDTVLGNESGSGSDDEQEEDEDEDEKESNKNKQKPRKRKRGKTSNDSDSNGSSSSSSSSSSSKRSRRNGNTSNNTSEDEKEEIHISRNQEEDGDGDGGLIDALVYNEAVEGMMHKLKEQFETVEPNLLQLQQTLPSSLIKGSDIESSLRNRILINAGVLKQLKYELIQKEERNNSMITMIGHEIEQQKELIATTESDIQNIDTSLNLLHELCEKHPSKKVFTLKRKKKQIMQIKKTVSGRVLRDDLQQINDEEDEDVKQQAASKNAAAKKRKAKKRKKKKKVPMVWNRALRAYIPVNVDGTEMQWRDH